MILIFSAIRMMNASDNLGPAFSHSQLILEKAGFAILKNGYLINYGRKNF